MIEGKAALVVPPSDGRFVTTMDVTGFTEVGP